MEFPTLGKYELRATRGRGAMGVVYEAWDPVISRRVAIKTVRLPDATDPEAQEQLARFRREAQAAGRLNHPNIVGVYDYGETDEFAYIAMEFVDGEALKAGIDRGERLPAGDIAAIMAQLLAGLAFSHQRGVVHRDIKPGNVMIAADGTVKITDFGIARIESSCMTQTGTMLGTPAYMSPEQFMGNATDARTDIYSAGALLFQLLTGRRPFEGAMSAIMHKVLSAPPPRPSALAPGLAAFDGVIAIAMAKEPEQRYLTVEAFAAALRQAFDDAAGGMEDPEATMFVGPARTVMPPLPVAMPATVAPPPAAARVGGGRVGSFAVGGTLAAALAIAGWYLLRPLAPVPPGAVAEVVATQPVPPVEPTPVVPTPVVPVVVPIPVQPPPTPAPPSLAALRAAAAPIECTLTNPQVNDEGLVFVTGLSRRGPPEAALRAAIGGVAASARIAWSVTGFDGPYCEALNVLRPMRLRDLRGSAALALTLKGDVTRLRQDERMVLRVVMPDFAAHLQVDYLSSDGTIGHLQADDGTSRHVWTPDGMKRIGPTRRYGPGEVVLIGEPDAASGFEGWAVDEPFGVDMVVAIAAAAPLRRTPPPVSESASVYFRDLRVALEAAEAEKVALSGQALLVETVRR